jgi:chromosome partitioning protein
VAATHVLIPIETHFKAFQGTNLLIQTIAKVKKRGNRSLKIAGFIPSRYAANNSQDKRTLIAIQEQFGRIGQVFDPIPRLTAFVDASEENLPLALYDPKNQTIAVLEKLTTLIEQLE